MKARFIVPVFGLLALAGTSAVSHDAAASVSTLNFCSVLSLATDGSTSTSRLFLDVQCSQGRFDLTAYHGFACTPSGVNKSQAVVDSFRSMAQASLLSGKKLTIKYENATGGGCANGVHFMQMY